MKIKFRKPQFWVDITYTDGSGVVWKELSPKMTAELVEFSRTQPDTRSVQVLSQAKEGR